MSAAVLATRWGLTYLQVAVSLLVGAAILSFWSHRLSVDCDRARSLCVARDQTPLSTAVHEIATSETLRARKQQGTYNGTSLFVPTWVELVAPDHVITVTHVAEGSYQSDKEAMVDQLNAFFRGSDAAPVHTAYGDRYGAWPQALLFTVLLLAIGRKVTLRASYDAGSKELVVERRLLGVLLQREHLAASTFRSAVADAWALIDPPRATQAKAFSDRTYGVGLLDEAGAMTPLPLWSSNKRLAVNLAEALTRTLAGQ